MIVLCKQCGRDHERGAGCQPGGALPVGKSARVSKRRGNGVALRSTSHPVTGPDINEAALETIEINVLSPGARVVVEYFKPVIDLTDEQAEELVRLVRRATAYAYMRKKQRNKELRA